MARAAGLQLCIVFVFCAVLGLEADVAAANEDASDAGAEDDSPADAGADDQAADASNTGQDQGGPKPDVARLQESLRTGGVEGLNKMLKSIQSIGGLHSDASLHIKRDESGHEMYDFRDVDPPTPPASPAVARAAPPPGVPVTSAPASAEPASEDMGVAPASNAGTADSTIAASAATGARSSASEASDSDTDSADGDDGVATTGQPAAEAVGRRPAVQVAAAPTNQQLVTQSPATSSQAPSNSDSGAHVVAASSAPKGVLEAAENTAAQEADGVPETADGVSEVDQASSDEDSPKQPAAIPPAAPAAPAAPPALGAPAAAEPPAAPQAAATAPPATAATSDATQAPGVPVAAAIVTPLVTVAAQGPASLAEAPGVQAAGAPTRQALHKPLRKLPGHRLRRNGQRPPPLPINALSKRPPRSTGADAEQQPQGAPSKPAEAMAIPNRPAAVQQETAAPDTPSLASAVRSAPTTPAALSVAADAATALPMSNAAALLRGLMDMRQEADNLIRQAAASASAAQPAAQPTAPSAMASMLSAPAPQDVQQQVLARLDALEKENREMREQLAGQSKKLTEVEAAERRDREELEAEKKEEQDRLRSSGALGGPVMLAEGAGQKKASRRKRGAASNHRHSLKPE